MRRANSRKSRPPRGKRSGQDERNVPIVGEVVKAFLDYRNLDQVEAAKRASEQPFMVARREKVSQVTMSYIVSGRQKKAQAFRVRAIAAALRVPFEYLTGAATFPEPHVDSSTMPYRGPDQPTPLQLAQFEFHTAVLRAIDRDIAAAGMPDGLGARDHRMSLAGWLRRLPSADYWSQILLTNPLAGVALKADGNLTHTAEWERAEVSLLEAFHTILEPWFTGLRSLNEQMLADTMAPVGARIRTVVLDANTKTPPPKRARVKRKA